MKIFVEKSFLASELKLFQGIFEKKTLMDILQNIKLTAFDGGILELVATDLEIGFTSRIAVDVSEIGTFTLNGRDFYDLISKMPEGIVEISENNDLQVQISNESKTSKYKLLGLQSSDYPKLPSSDFYSKIVLPIPQIQSMINKNYYIISPEMKFNLGGALISLSSDRLEMAATDGHRMAYTHFEGEFDTAEQLEFIISRKTLLELLKIGTDGEFEFSYDKNNLFFKHNNRILSSRIIDQKFPNYKAVIPEKIEHNALVDSAELLHTLRRILILKTRNNGVLFRFAQDKLVLERTTPEKGEGHDEIIIEYSGPSFDVAFNGSFIIDFLTHIDSEKTQIGIVSTDSSFIFEPSAGSDINFMYVVMPLNI